MVRRLSTSLLLGPSDVPASRPDLDVVGVLNPGVVRAGSEVVMLVRVAERPRERRAGFTGLPRWDASAGITVDWTPNDEIEVVDPRIVRRKSDGLIRLTFISHLRLVRCGDGRATREVTNTLFAPENDLEEFGVEDPRITAIGDRYYITYVAVSRHGPATALASTTDFRTFERHGVIFCPENKDVVLFPETIAGRYVALHRPVCRAPFCRPEIWVAQSDDLLHWGRHAPLDLGTAEWQSGRIGAGAPPIRVDGGWLELYHGNRQPSHPGDVGAYYGGAALLDAENPSRVLRRATEPILVPETEFESTGFVPNVVFPTGIVEDGDTLLVYYGAADASTAVVELSKAEVLASVGAHG